MWDLSMGPELIDFFFGCGHSCNFMHASRFLYCRGPILESIEVTKGQGISFMKDRLGDTCFVEAFLVTFCSAHSCCQSDTPKTEHIYTSLWFGRVLGMNRFKMESNCQKSTRPKHNAVLSLEFKNSSDGSLQQQRIAPAATDSFIIWLKLGLW